jgi:hypothetical protein
VSGVGAHWNEREAFLAGPIDGFAHKPSPDSPTFERLGDPSVHEDKPSSVASVHQLGDRALLSDDESMVGVIVEHWL